MSRFDAQPADPAAQLVYLVEDDDAVALLVAKALQSFSFRVERFGSGDAFLRRFAVQRPDVCIVDLGLPDMDGIELVQQVSSCSSCGLLILSGRDDPIDRVMGLELGSDDYVTKPFDARELVARVRSIVRRRQDHGEARHPAQKRYARFLGWQLDCASNLLCEPDGSEHFLGTAEAVVLKAFVKRPHQILSREQLLGQREIAPLDRSIDVRISRLRRKLEADPQNPKIIKTVYGAGYLFAAAVSWS
jgi:DNA-binding response OmpR family regulator